MESNKTRCDIFYPLNFISLIIILALLKKKENRNKKILFINSYGGIVKSKHLQKKVFIYFQDYLMRYFDEIHYVKYKRTIKNNTSRLLKILNRSSQAKINEKNTKLKLKKNFKVENIYASGDDFEILLLNKLGYFPKFHFLEHGLGNILSFIYDLPSTKYLIYNLITRILYKLNFLKYYPIKYSSYVGVLSKNFNKKKFINERLVKKTNNLDIDKILLELSLFIKKKTKIKRKKIKYVLFNYSTIIISKDQNDFKKLLKKIISLIDKKKECVLIKGHPSWSSFRTENFIKLMIIYFKKNNINYQFIKKKSFLNKLPAELIIELFKIKKVISDLSSSIFQLSNSNKKIKCYLPYTYLIKNRFPIEYAAQINYTNYFYTMGKKVKFI